MKKEEFLQRLEKQLRARAIPNVDQILNKYRGLQLTENQNQQSVSQTLKNPSAIARAYEVNYLISVVNSSIRSNQLRKLLRLMGLLLILNPSNIFIFLFPGLLILVILTIGWLFSLSILSLSMGILAIALTAGFIKLSVWISIAIGSISMSLLGISVGCMLAMYLMSRFGIFGIVQLFKINSRSKLMIPGGW